MNILKCKEVQAEEFALVAVFIRNAERIQSQRSVRDEMLDQAVMQKEV